MNQKEMQLITDQIRRLRASKNYSQEYMAAKMHISQNAYSKIELNYSQLTVERLIAIARLLGTDAGTLIRECIQKTTKAA